MEPPRQEAPSLEPNSVVGDTYRIDHHVAHGGSSVVYSARHVEMDRRVALKVLPLDGDIDASALERFSQEARLACQINHPNVVTIYQFGQDARGLLYIAMEWLEGISLSNAVEERGSFSALRVAQIGREVARGLAAAHEHEVLHRDLKPSNVMLAELAGWEEIAKLLDFGVAKSLAPTEEDQLRITQEGKFVGTPRYAAPELIRGDELTVRTDIYGTGLLMWEALTGEPAVQSVVFQECCAQHLSDEPWELPDSANCPAPLAEVIETSLRKDPGDRYASCRELAEALGEAVHEIATERSADGSATVASDARGWGSYGSQWMKLLFVLAVGLAVLGFAGYQGWLRVTESADSGGVSTAGAMREVQTPTQLLERLRDEGWSVRQRDRLERGGTRYQLGRGPSTVTMVVEDAPDREAASRQTIVFPAFTVRVEPSDSPETKQQYRLLSRLYALRAATGSKGDADSSSRGGN